MPTILSPNTSTQQPARRSLAGALNTLATLPPRRRYTLLGGVLAALLVLIIGGTLLVSILQPIGSIPYPPERGVLALNDLLQDNSRGYSWPDASSSNGGCEFSQNSYHVLASQQGASRYCIAGNTGYGNFVYEVQMTLLRGDGGGLIFRANGTNGQFYYFRVGRDGSYALYLYSSTNSNHVQTLVSNVTPAIRTGLNIANTLAIVARDDTFNLYINKQLVTTVKDARYSSGEIGVAADSNPDPTEASFNNAHVWTI